jgi:DNA polymerase III gamma/tau subunit
MVRQFVVVFVALLASAPQGVRASEHDHLVAKHAATHGVPESLVRRVIQIESKGNPRVVSSGNYGLMQIRLGTARAMGYSGDASGLLDADTNMTYAVRYLAGAYRAAGGNQEQAIRNYQRGYYDTAKAQGFSPYAVAAMQPQAAAPDPTMLRQPQELERRSVAEQQRLERQAMLDARISQQKAAEQTRIAERQTMLQARAEQQKAAEQARVAQRQALVQERIDRQVALQQKRDEQRQAMLQQKTDREQARQKPSISPAEPPRTGPQAQPSAQPVAAAPKRAPDPSYAWYNPMRFFKHPLHQSHPLPRDR